MKKYIVSIDDIGALTTAAALQDSKIFLEKDNQSAFYIAHIEDGIQIPDNIKALEMGRTKTVENTEKPNNNSEGLKKFLDLRLCIEIPKDIDKTEVEKVLCKEISKTLKSLVKGR
jgi:adenine-specific DNA methylase